MNDAGRTATILVVDDDPVLVETVASLLELEGFGVIASYEPQHALDRASAADALDLLLSDVAMPLLDGPGLAALIRAARPEVRVLYMSGYPVEVASESFGLPEGAPFLRKPFTRAALTRAIRDALAG